MNLEAKERELLQQKILDFGSNGSGVTDYSWLLNAGQSLVRSRRVLAYSYVLAFHVFGDEILKDIVTPTEKEVKQNLFEYHQQQLQQAVERLSMLIHHQNFMANRREAIDLTVLAVTVLADTGCEQIYEWIQNDLLLNLGLTTHRIAPYNPKGIHILSDMM